MSGKNLLYYDFDDFRLDVVNDQLLKDGKPVFVTQKSLEILEYLIKNRGRLLKKKELLNSIWADTFVEESTLTQHIYMLRKALKENSKREVPIETISKNGYRFIGKVKEVFQKENLEVSEKIEPLELPKESAKSKLSTNFFQRKILFIGLIVLIIFTTFGANLYFNQSVTEKKTHPMLINSIAVLPFQQINAENEEKLGLGMADVIIAQLGKLENVQITPTSSITQFTENKDLDLFEIGRKLNVEAILVGTIHREGEDVRVTYQVYSVKDKQPILSDKIDGKYINMFVLQDAVSEQILHQLALTISKIKSSSNIS